MMCSEIVMSVLCSYEPVVVVHRRSCSPVVVRSATAITPYLLAGRCRVFGSRKFENFPPAHMPRLPVTKTIFDALQKSRGLIFDTILKAGDGKRTAFWS